MLAPFVLATLMFTPLTFAAFCARPALSRLLALMFPPLFSLVVVAIPIVTPGHGRERTHSEHRSQHQLAQQFPGCHKILRSWRRYAPPERRHEWEPSELAQVSRSIS